MTQHPGSLTFEQRLSTAEVLPGLAKASPLATGLESRPELAALPPPAARGRRPRKLLLLGASLLCLAGAAYFGWQYWTVGRFEVSTDDAYVQADSTTVAPGDKGDVQLKITATSDAPLGDQKIMVKGTPDQGEAVSLEFKVTVVAK